MVIKTVLTFRHVEGPEVDSDTLLDAFAATVGEQNTAPQPLRVIVGSEDSAELGGPAHSVYLLELVDG